MESPFASNAFDRLCEMGYNLTGRRTMMKTMKRKDAPMNLKLHLARAQTRREFFKNSGVGLGALALTTLLQQDGSG
jgi:hypothetical protein